MTQPHGHEVDARDTNASFGYPSRNLTIISSGKPFVPLGVANDIQAKALEEGMPYQTLIASVLHKYVTNKLVEKEPPARARRRDRIAVRPMKPCLSVK